MQLSEAAERIKGAGFIAALDQSGGSTPKALRAYGIEEDAWGDDKEKMFELVHEMRARIITSPSFDNRISGTILFERTMNSTIEGMPTAKYLLERKDIVPFLKVDEGLQEEERGVQRMKPITGLEERLQSALAHSIFGTKMRSVIKSADSYGVQGIVEQQFEVADKILDKDLMPIIEPEVDIKAPDKAQAEELLRAQLHSYVDALPDGKHVMLKLTLPEEANFYEDLIQHDKVLRVVALSGGYSREEANEKLAANHGMTASFSRALVQDLRKDQSDEEFNAALDAAIQSIYDASLT